MPAFYKIMTDFKDGFPSGKDAEWNLAALAHLWYEDDSLANQKKNNQPLTVKESNLKYWQTKGVDDPHCMLHGSQCTWGRIHNFKPHQWMTFTRMGPPAGILSHYFSALGQAPQHKYECYSPFCVLFDGSSVAGPPSVSKRGAALHCSRRSMKMGDTAESHDRGQVDAAFIKYLEQSHPGNAAVSVTVDFNTAKDDFVKLNNFCSDVDDFMARHTTSLNDCMERQDTMATIENQIALWLGEDANAARTSADMHGVYICPCRHTNKLDEYPSCAA